MTVIKQVGGVGIVGIPAAIALFAFATVTGFAPIGGATVRTTAWFENQGNMTRKPVLNMSASDYLPTKYSLDVVVGKLTPNPNQPTL